jgi:hypothetical protein
MNDMIQSSNDANHDGATTALSDTARYRLLADDRRRTVLGVLATRTGPIDLMELATVVAVHESDADEIPDGALERVAVALHHQHLPKLDEVDVVDYDTEASRVLSARVLERFDSDALQITDPPGGATDR